MIDIHTHVLPNVDDGAKNWDVALNMLKFGAAEGITRVVCTPHVLDHLDRDLENKFKAQFKLLKSKVAEAEIPIQLYLGSEIHCLAQFDLHSSVVTFNGNGKYMLIELPMAEVPTGFSAMCLQYQKQGVVPILAHPERNLEVIRNPEIVYNLVKQGVLMQVSAGSFLGFFGTRAAMTAFRLLDHRLIHFVASDGHGTGLRNLQLKPAYEVILKRKGHETADMLFIHFPQKAIEGKTIRIPDPIPIPERNKVGEFFSLIRFAFGQRG